MSQSGTGSGFTAASWQTRTPRRPCSGWSFAGSGLWQNGERCQAGFPTQFPQTAAAAQFGWRRAVDCSILWPPEHRRGATDMMMTELEYPDVETTAQDLARLLNQVSADPEL